MKLLPLGLDQGVGAVVWSPLGWGRLTGKIRRGTPPPPTSRLHATAAYGPPVDDEHLFRVVDVLEELSRETGRAVPQIAVNWLLQRPTVATVIIGARNEEQLRQNVEAVGWSLHPNRRPGSTLRAPVPRPTRTSRTSDRKASPDSTLRRSRFPPERRLCGGRRRHPARHRCYV
ncbi:aldo/keto reductase [Dactylosporangium darangshiense]|uniref:aldo/keto reductase n=1 Tax=Dactylosporangium darangshiense TaxID=579108 RepID=UPI00363D64AC